MHLNFIYRPWISLKENLEGSDDRNLKLICLIHFLLKSKCNGKKHITKITIYVNWKSYPINWITWQEHIIPNTCRAASALIYIISFNPHNHSMRLHLQGPEFLEHIILLFFKRSNLINVLITWDFISYHHMFHINKFINQKRSLVTMSLFRKHDQSTSLVLHKGQNFNYLTHLTVVYTRVEQLHPKAITG